MIQLYSRPMVPAMSFRSAIFGIFLSTWIAGCTTHQAPTDSLKSWGVNLAFDAKWKTVNSARVTNPPSEALTLNRGESDGETLRLQRLTAESAKAGEDYIAGRMSDVLRAYDTTPEPYQGFVTREVECATDFHPKILSRGDLAHPKRVLSLYANSRFVFGACTSDTAQFRAILAAVFCARTHALIWIEYFQPTGSLDKNFPKALEGIDCT